MSARSTKVVPPRKAPPKRNADEDENHPSVMGLIDRELDEVRGRLAEVLNGFVPQWNTSYVFQFVHGSEGNWNVCCLEKKKYLDANGAVSAMSALVDWLEDIRVYGDGEQ